MRRPSRPSAALVIASLALAAALAPPAYSALAPKLAKNTVGSPQIKDKSIQATDLDKNVVTTSKIARGQVRRSDLADGSVDFTKIADGTIGGAEIAANSVDGGKIADGSVGQTDLASPTQLRAWTTYPSSEVAVAPAATLDLGSLVASAGGPLVLNRPAALRITGQVYVNPTLNQEVGVKGRLSCTVTVDGIGLAPRTWVRVEQGDEATVPVYGVAIVQAGSHDVGLSCQNNSTGAVAVNVGRAGISVLAVPQ
jgi:hypothetical protein